MIDVSNCPLQPYRAAAQCAEGKDIARPRREGDSTVFSSKNLTNNVSCIDTLISLSYPASGCVLPIMATWTKT